MPPPPPPPTVSDRERTATAPPNPTQAATAPSGVAGFKIMARPSTREEGVRPRGSLEAAVAAMAAKKAPQPVPPVDATPTPTTTAVRDLTKLDCDLCGSSVQNLSYDEHQSRYHGTLLQLLGSLESVDAPALQVDGVVAQSVVAALGKQARAIATSGDKGERVFQTAVNAAEQLTAIVQATRWPRCRAYVFGSCVAMGVWDGEGDVDMTIIDPKLWDKGTWPSDEGRFVLDLCRVLRASGFEFDDLEPVVHTRVPIVKHKVHRKFRGELWRFDDPRSRTLCYQLKSAQQDPVCEQVERYFSGAACKWHDSGRTVEVVFPSGAEALEHLHHHNPLKGIAKLEDGTRPTWWDKAFVPEVFFVDFDASARAFGVRNSFLLRAYMEQSPLVRAGSIFVKKWSKASGLNNSMKGYLTSYAVNIAWIYFLLRRRAVRFVPPASIPFTPDENAHKNVKYIETVPQDVPDTFNQDLGELLLDFFRFYATEFDWEHDVVSVSRTEKTTKESLGWRLQNEVKAAKFRDRVWYRACIEDPYEANLSLGRHMSPIKVRKARGEFILAWRSLVEAGRPGDSGGLASLLRDRTAAAVGERVRAAALRVMIGRKQMPMVEFQKTLRDKCLVDLAAYEVEFRFTHLIDAAGLRLQPQQTVVTATRRVEAGDNSDTESEDEVVMNTDEASASSSANPEMVVAHAKPKRTYVPLEAAAVIAALDLALADPLQRVLGVRAPPTAARSRWPLDAFYATDKASGRFFLRTKDCEVFQDHVNFVFSALRESKSGSVVVSQLFDDAVTKLRGFQRGLLQDVLGDERLFALRDNGETVEWLPEQKEKAQPRAKPAVGPPIRDRDRQNKGLCDGCNVEGPVWPATERARDEGWYCDKCWREFE